MDILIVQLKKEESILASPPQEGRGQLRRRGTAPDRGGDGEIPAF